MSSLHAVCLAGAALAAGCSAKSSASSAEAPDAREVPENRASTPAPDAHGDFAITRLDTPPGLSGLAFDPGGTLWAVAERGGHLVSVMPGESRARTERTIVGVADGLDLESLDFLPDGRIVFGTESDDDAREADMLLFGEVVGDEVRIVSSLPMAYKAWDQASKGNQGIEAVCVANDKLVALGESQLPATDQRLAPLGVYDLGSKTWATYRLALTSDEGKIAGATCRATSAGVEVFAIERHYEVRRVLRWTVPAGAETAPIRPAVAFDFSDLSDDNPEGIDWLPDGRLVVVTDNQSGPVVKGEGKLLVFHVE